MREWAGEGHRARWAKRWGTLRDVHRKGEVSAFTIIDRRNPHAPALGAVSWFSL